MIYLDHHATTPVDARVLEAAPGSAAFESERVSSDAGGAPVVFDRVFIPGDRFRITRELSYREHGGPIPTTADPQAPKEQP